MSLWAFVCSVHLCSLWEKICHSSFVIMSLCLQNHTLSPFVIMSFCLQKNHLSPFVIMSFCLQKSHLSPFVIMSFCLQKNHLSPSVPLLFCLKKSLCLYLSLCYSVSHLFCLYRVEKSWQWCVLGSGIKKGDMYKIGVCNYHVFSWL